MAAGLKTSAQQLSQQSQPAISKQKADNTESSSKHAPAPQSELEQGVQTPAAVPLQQLRPCTMPHDTAHIKVTAGIPSLATRCALLVQDSMPLLACPHVLALDCHHRLPTHVRTHTHTHTHTQDEHDDHHDQSMDDDEEAREEARREAKRARGILSSALPLDADTYFGVIRCVCVCVCVCVCARQLGMA